MDETQDWDALSPHEKLESPRGRYLVAEALHYGQRTSAPTTGASGRSGLQKATRRCAASAWTCDSRQVRARDP